MGNKPTVAGNIIKEYIRRFPDVGNRALARKIYAENGLVFKSPEAARGILRYYRGSMGDKLRSSLKDKTMVKDFSNNFTDLFSIKRGEKYNFKPYKTPTNIKKIGIVNDVHIPYHDKRALLTALEYLHSKDIDCLLLNGDIMDCYQISRWQTDPRKRSLKYELDTTRQFLQDLRAAFGDTLIIYKEGNHEERWKKYLISHAPQLLDNPEFEIDIVLRLEEIGIKFVDNKRIIQAGKLNIIHGHEFGTQIWSPVNPSRGFYLKSKNNVLGGHHHQTSEHLEPDINGKILAAWSLGCLCDLHPEYRPINKWNHGFATVSLYPGGNFDVENDVVYEPVLVWLIYIVTYWCDLKPINSNRRTEPFSFLFERWQN